EADELALAELLALPGEQQKKPRHRKNRGMRSGAVLTSAVNIDRTRVFNAAVKKSKRSKFAELWSPVPASQRVRAKRSGASDSKSQDVKDGKDAKDSLHPVRKRLRKFSEMSWVERRQQRDMPARLGDDPKPPEEAKKKTKKRP